MLMSIFCLVWFYFKSGSLETAYSGQIPWLPVFYHNFGQSKYQWFAFSCLHLIICASAHKLQSLAL